MATQWPISGCAAFALPMDNVDTDQLIPARFMSTPRSEGYGQFLFHDLKPSDAPSLIPPQTRVLVAGSNFGCGSSREAAVYALVDFGVQVVIAHSFGDIFASNAVNNGLLPARIKLEDASILQDRLSTDLATLGVDLERQSIAAGNVTIPFDIDPVWKLKLLNGWDDIDLTRTYAETIKDFCTIYRIRSPWTVPSKPES